MAEDLQNLLDRIQKDGVEKAESEAARIEDAARKNAQGIVSDAKDEAARLKEKAEEEAGAFEQRARQSLQQAARDAVLSVGQALNGALATLVRREVEASLTPETLAEMLVQLVEAYTGQSADGSGAATTRIDVLLAPEQQEAVTALLMDRFAGQIREGLEIKGDGRVVAGFRVSVVGGSVEHDFSSDAITESMCQLLRPQLAEILREAVKTGDA